MRKLPIILTLFLTAVWAYTCWYWYTCNIKGFCDKNVNYTTSQVFDNATYNSREVEQEDIIIENIKSSPKLSAKDVLFDPLPKEIEQKTTTQEKEITQSGSVTQDSTEIIELEKEDDKDLSSKTATICEQPLVGPIVLGGDNDKGEVEKLETFLISRGEDINIDGEYGNDDVEAVKRFQLKYKEDVLDPWGITTPTGYVGKTSIAKINKLACK